MKWSSIITLAHRAVNTTRSISDGEVIDDSINWGETAYWAIPTGGTFYITLNTCAVPRPSSTVNATVDRLWNGQIPSLTLYGSNVSTIPLPNSANAIDIIPFQFGFANLTYHSDSIYFSVAAPPRDGNWTDSAFSYQVGVSSIKPLHSALAGDQNRFIFLQDSDFSAALLTTGNLTSNELPNYQIWVNPSEVSVGENGIAASIQSALKWSWCGITNSNAQVTIENADRSMTTRGPGGLPKEQFYVHGLTPSTFYDAYITLQNNFSQGGTVWPVQQFRTRDTETCQVIYNLGFCSEVAYSVPSNSTLFNPVALGAFYDNLAESYYRNFSTTLQTFNCNTTNDAIYSLVSSCDTCKDAYHDWVCAATIPRCADLTNPATYLVTRNVSRNPIIDETLSPGKYKEVLPCADLVQSITRTCPANLGFRVPLKNAFTAAYGQRSNNATVTCNAPGVDFWVAASSRPIMNPLVLFALFIAYIA